MFEIAFAISLFSYSIFFLGLAGFLYKPLLVVFTFLYWGGLLLYKRKSFENIFQKLSTIKKYGFFFSLGTLYICLQALINSVGLFGPEIGFDALWYHLTLPKLYLFYHAVVHFPGTILYYSDMPHLTEMLYTVGLSFGSDFFAHLIHFLFGILTCIVLYKLARKFVAPPWAILVPVIFYSNLVVGWESISGYIDLSRTFFATIALLSFFAWIEKKEKKYFAYSALLVGLTISTKLLALPDIFIYSIALYFIDRKKIIPFVGLVLLPCLPWFVFSFMHTGNPIYPMLSPLYQVKGYWWTIFNPLSLPIFFWQTFALSSDPVNPVFLAFFPLVIFWWKKLIKEIPLLLFFALGGLFCWYITPQTGGGRYILPYLSSVSVVFVYAISSMHKKWQIFFVFFISIIAIISLFYRGLAVSKFVPVILGKETQGAFLSTHLQYNLGDFYDTDNYFANHIKPTDTVLLYGFHNLYYINFPYIHADWVQKGDAFNYVAVQGENGLPDRFRYWNLVYFNAITEVRLYSLLGKTWYY